MCLLWRRGAVECHCLDCWLEPGQQRWADAGQPSGYHTLPRTNYTAINVCECKYEGSLLWNMLLIARHRIFRLGRSSSNDSAYLFSLEILCTFGSYCLLFVPVWKEMYVGRSLCLYYRRPLTLDQIV